ncbi:MAG: electron transport complex subunit RsxC [Pseudomonadota bacterium]
MSEEQTLAVSPNLHRFNGGLHLPTRKSQSTERPLVAASLPSQLILPLQQHIGQNAEPVVREGNRVLKGQVVAKAPAYVSAPIHAPTSGTVREVGPMPVPHPSGLSAPCLVIEPDGRDEWTELSPIEDFRSLDPISLRNRIREAGIVGLGGAAFPSAVKLNPGPSRKLELLVINGAECEPYITCDQTLMSERADEVIGGIQVALHTLGVERCWVAIEDSMPDACRALQKALEERGDERIELKVVPTIYPTGGEKQLIKVLTGREVPSNGLPADIGVVCHNPGTVAAMYRAVVYGEPLISRIVTVTGDGVAEPRNLEVLFGTPIAHLVEAAGGYTPDVERLIMGGPMMGFALHTDELPVVKASNCILAATREEIADPGAADPCIRCGACADVCPADLLPQQLYWYSKSREFDRAQDEYNLFDCIECGACSYVCPSHIPLVQYYRFAKTEIRNAEVERRKAEHAKERHDFRLERLEREQREKAEAMRRKKEMLARKKAEAADKGSGDSDGKPGQDAIAAAVARAEARKAEKARSGEGREKVGGNDAKQAAIAAAKARAKANAEGSPAAASDAEEAKRKAIEAAKQRAKAQSEAPDPAAEARKKAVEAAKARAQAKGDGADQDPKKAAIEAAKAKALAKQKGGDAERSEAASETGDPKKAAIEAAKQRAMEKQKGESDAKPAEDPRKAAIEAAKQRALAKQATSGENGSKSQEKPAETTTDTAKPTDPKKAAIEAAKQRALARQQSEDTDGNEEPSETDAAAEDPKKAAIEAAKKRALAKARERGDS